MNTLILESLTQDFRDLWLHSGRAASRRQVDTFIQWCRSASISQLTEVNKAFSTQLASVPAGGEALCFAEHALPLGGDPDLIRAARQTVGFFSRLHANVTEDMKLEQLAAAADRLAERRPIRLTDVEVALCREFIIRAIGRRPPDPRNLRFRHGPGAVATHEKGLQKIHFRETFISVDEYLGYDSEVLLRLPHAPQLFLERNEPITRVIAVPKDALRIRTISCEPLTMQFFQQGLMDELFTRMVRRYGNHFPFANQSVSQRLAQMGSEAGYWGRSTQPCTIDMSNASDDVKVDHIRLLFPDEWADCLLAFRSTAARFEELGREVELSTFAPMGAATCFPVESLVFASIRYAAARLMRVYREEDLWAVVGDDVITVAKAYDLTLDMLERAAFTPNVSKCCGPAVRFRESCGGDYFEGVSVTYERPRQLPKWNRFQANVPTVQLATALAHRGFVKTAQLIANTTKGPVAIGDGDAYAHPGLRWPVVGRTRYNRSLQRFEQQAVVEIPLPGTRLGAVDGWEPLYQWFTSGWRSETSFPISKGRNMRVRKIWLPVSGQP